LVRRLAADIVRVAPDLELEGTVLREHRGDGGERLRELGGGELHRWLEAGLFDDVELVRLPAIGDGDSGPRGFSPFFA
jgi:hypothetical protein